MDPTQQITSLYQQYLGRAPDEAGLQFWTGALNQGYTPEQIQQQISGSAEATGVPAPRDPSTYSYGLAQNGATGTAWRDNPAMTQLMGKSWATIYDKMKEYERLSGTDPFAAESLKVYLQNQAEYDPVRWARLQEYAASPVGFYKTYGISDGQFLDPSVMEGLASVRTGTRGSGAYFRDLQNPWAAARMGRMPVEELRKKYNQQAQYTGNTGLYEDVMNRFGQPAVRDSERGPRQEGANWAQSLTPQQAYSGYSAVRAANPNHNRVIFDGALTLSDLARNTAANPAPAPLSVVQASSNPNQVS